MSDKFSEITDLIGALVSAGTSEAAYQYRRLLLDKLDSVEAEHQTLRAENERLKSSQTCEVCQNPIAARTHAEIIERLRNENERLRGALEKINQESLVDDYFDQPRLQAIRYLASDALKGGEKC